MKVYKILNMSTGTYIQYYDSYFERFKDLAYKNKKHAENYINKLCGVGWVDYKREYFEIIKIDVSKEAIEKTMYYVKRYYGV